tara:strand:- start:7461 stop:10106 length:2646 start_codon:yes stop_codon:yes gene_type:complete
MKKYILSIAILLVLLLGCSIFLPYLFKDKIIETIKSEANKTLKAELDFDNNIHINIFKSFPNLNLSFKDLSLTYPDSTFQKDTFFAADKLEVSFDLMKFYKEQKYQFKSIAIDRPILHLELLNDSTVNWDIAIATEEDISEESTALNFELDNIQIENGALIYTDVAADMAIHLTGLNHTASGNFNTDAFTLTSETSIAELKVVTDGIAYLNNWSITQEGDIAIDMTNSKYSFPKNSVFINGLPIDLDGYMQLLNEDIIFDIAANSSAPDLNKFLTLIPAIYTSDFASMQTKGSGKLNVTFKGTYNDTSFPAYDMKVKVDDGYFKYPDLALPAEDIHLDLHVYSLDGNTDRTVVDIPRMHFKLANDPFDLKLTMQDLSGNILIDADAKGKIDLTNLTKIVPLPDTELSGTITTDLQIAGRVKDISASAIDKFKANGTLVAQNIHYTSADMNEALDVKTAELLVQNQRLNIPIFEGKVGKNDINFSGLFNNFFGYALSNQTLTGSAMLTSTHFNANDFITESESEESIEMTLVEVPGNVDLDFTASIATLIYDDLTLTNFSGAFGVKNRTVELRNVASDLLGGRVNLEGAYIYDLQKPMANFDISYSDIKIADLLAKFKVVRAFAPIAEQVQAMTTAKLNIATELNNDMSLKLESINVGGSLNLEKIVVDKLEVLKGIDTKLGTTHFNVKSLRDFLVKFNIKDGKLFVSPFDLFIDSSKLAIDGVSKLDGSIDYNGILSIPSSYISNETSIVNGLTAGTRFSNLQLNTEDFLDIAMQIVGTFKKPEITLNLKEIKTSIKQNIKNTVSNEVDKQKEKAKELATDEVNKIKEETKKRADEAKAKLEAEIALKKKEAADRLKQEAEKQKEDLKKQAEDKLKGIFKK